MHDTLDYLRHDPVHRKQHHRNLTFGLLYAYTENFVLPLSHDEVVHGKGPLHRQDAGRRVAEVREPARALRMDVRVPRHASSCSWGARSARPVSGTTTAASTGGCSTGLRHAGVRDLVARAQRRRRVRARVVGVGPEPAGFRWLDADDAEHSIYSFVRFSEDGRRRSCVRRELHARSTRGIPARPALPGLVEDASRHERKVVLGHWVRRRRRRRDGASGVARLRRLGSHHVAAARGRVVLG